MATKATFRRRVVQSRTITVRGTSPRRYSGLGHLDGKYSVDEQFALDRTVGGDHKDRLCLRKEPEYAYGAIDGELTA